MISTQEMKQLEDNCGIPKVVLMENAGRGIAEILKEKFDLKDKKSLLFLIMETMEEMVLLLLDIYAMMQKLMFHLLGIIQS